MFRLTSDDEHAGVATEVSGLRDQVREPDWGAMERRLLAAFDGHRQERRRERGAVLVTRRVRTWQPLAAAVVLGLAAAIVWYPVDRGRHGPAPPPVAAPKRPAVQQPPPATPAPVRPAPAQRTLPRAPETPGQQPASPASLLADFDDFVALPEAAALPDFESGRIVRVEVPLAALPAYGLIVVPDATVAAVPADLLIGQDGVPRAIRLASTSVH
jgi:hypothetical protein